MNYVIQAPQQLPLHLRALRKNKGLSQAQLGRLLGLSQTRIARIEKDPTSVSVDQLLKVLAALNAQLALVPHPAGIAGSNRVQLEPQAKTTHTSGKRSPATDPKNDDW